MRYEQSIYSWIKNEHKYIMYKIAKNTSNDTEWNCKVGKLIFISLP